MHSEYLRTGVGCANVFCETLEQRQLMSLTIEVRNPDGSASGTATAVGQVLNLEVLAVITSSDNQPTEDGLQDVQGSFLSTALGGHPVNGNLAAENIAPFKAFGATPGKEQDLNGDGNIDQGSNSPIDGTDYFLARANPIQSSVAGTAAGNTLSFKIATLAYTITALNKGGSTAINFAPFVNPDGISAEWMEDNTVTNNAIGTFQAGTPFTVSDPALIVPPTAVNDSATVAINTPTVINELGNDDVIQPLNDASVTITAAGHGTTQLQSNGSILYTPAHGYLGSDSFTYTVADIDRRVSNPATVNITVVPTPAPIAGAISATTFLDQPVVVNVLVHASSVATLGSVAVASAPAHGTAIVQVDGSMLYTPSNGYLGSDTFTYTVSDSNDETSSAATVTVEVDAPVLPKAKDDSFNIVEGTPTSLNVMANDVQESITSNTIVLLSSDPSHGTAVVQSDQTVLYTPTAGYSGADSFTYVLVDALEEPSAPATVTLSIAPAAPPTAGNVSAAVLSGQSSTIDVLSNVSGGLPIVPSSVKIAAAPADGNAVVNSDGSISYTPRAGFVGSDAFTYTAADNNGTASAPGTVTVDVGTSISNARGSAHSIRFTDAAGGVETIALNRGTAEIFFTGSGSLTVARNGKATVTGPGLNLGTIALSNTTAASSLSIKGSVRTPVAVGGISDSSPLGSIAAASANLGGSIHLDSAGSISALAISGATITTTGNIAALSAGSLSNSTISAGASAAATFATASATDLGSATIGSIRVGKGGYAASDILAGKITSASLGAVSTANGGTPFGIAAKSIGSFAGTFAGAPLHLRRPLLQNQEVLQAYLNQKGVSFGDFAIELDG